MTLEELAYHVCTALDRAGCQVVLSGGAAAVVYAPEVCQSMDVDLVTVGLSTLEPPPFAAVLAAGLRPWNERTGIYVHPESPFTVEFIEGPLDFSSAAAPEILDEWDTLRREQQILNILTPTYSVVDRLCHHMCNGDIKAVDQAVGVALAQADRVDLTAVHAYCLRHRSELTYRVFEARRARASAT